MFNFDNYTPTIESSFKSELVLRKKGKEKHVKSDSDTYDDELEALMDRRHRRGKGKYKGKLPIIYFSCNKVGHIVARCPNREDKYERRQDKYKGKWDDSDNKRNKNYKEKGKKSYYIFEEETNNESESNDEEVVYVAMKEYSDEDEKIALILMWTKVIDG